MNKVFDAYLKRAQAVHAQYGVLERRYLSIDPAKVKQRRDLLYLLLTEPEHWVEAIAREKATRTVRAEKTKLYTEAERHARNVRLAEKFDARLSTARHRGRPISIARHTDSFLKSLPSASLFRFLYARPCGWQPLYDQYKIWVAEEVSIACEAMDDFIGYFIAHQSPPIFLTRYGGADGKKLVSTFAAGGAYSEEEVIAAIVATATRIGTTGTYRINTRAVERVLAAWTAYKQTPVATRRMKGRKSNHLDFHIFSKNLGL